MNANSALVCSLANLPINAPVESRFWSPVVPARPQIRHFERTHDQASAAIVAYTCSRFPFKLSLSIFHVVTDLVTTPHVSRFSEQERPLTW